MTKNMNNMSKSFNFILIFLLSILFDTSAYCDPAASLVDAARTQIGQTILYDPGYQTLTYPNGDVPIERGVCTDVIIRAMRRAFNFDLQKRVHEDMKLNFSAYPQHWGLKRPDKNIDHRRVPNLQAFFTRQGWSLEVSDQSAAYRPGDVVTCVVPPNLPHIMIVSSKKSSDGIPLVIHNIGAGTQEENRLFEFNLTGHYRIAGIDQANSANASPVEETEQ
jgi:hypothetical protein